MDEWISRKISRRVSESDKLLVHGEGRVHWLVVDLQQLVVQGTSKNSYLLTPYFK